MSNPVAIHSGANWKNVNNWHWIEKDCTAWAHDRIKSLLTSMACQDLSITKVTNIEGEVSVNQRKGRVKQLFDLEISFEYKKSADGTSGTGFISDFTADYEDPSDLNLKLTPRLENVSNVLKAVGEVAKAFKTELHETHGKPLLLEASQANEANGSTSPNGSSATSTTSEISETPKPFVSKPSQPTQTSQTPQLTTTIEDEVTFPCPPDQLYLMLTDAARIRSWTRASASLPQILLPGASFTLFDGNIICKLVALKASERIEMEWKLRAWSQNSSVVIDLAADKQGGAVLKMKQTGVPSGEAEITKNNWHNYYWNPIKRAFGVLL